MKLGPQFEAASGRWWNSSAVIMSLALTMVLAIPLCAQTRVFRDGNSWIEETTGSLPAGREFRAFTEIGSFQVQGSATQVSYVVRKRSFADSEEAARRQFEQLRFSASKAGDAVVLEGQLTGRNHNRLTADIAVQIPRQTQVVKVETRAGSLSFNSISGSITGVTGGGAVKLDDISGPVKITSAGGLVEAGNMGSNVFLQSGGGNVSVEKVNGQVVVKTGGGRVRIGTSGGTTIETGAGNIEVNRCNGDLRANSGGGNLSLGDVYGSVVAETNAGSVRLASAQGGVRVVTGGGTVELLKVGQSAQVETGAGAITVQFVAGRNQFRDSFLHTAAGDVVVYLPSDLGVSVHASTDLASGQGITSAFPGLAITSEGGTYGPKSMFAEGALNGGGPVLRVRTTIGKIDIRRSQ
jgi:DUF4097 and DUF4098 domain-containing protein YvlB